MQTLGHAWEETPFGAFHEINIERDKPVHHGARQLLEIWTAREAEGRFTVGVDVPSRGLARLLSGLALLQPILHGDFRVRLAGLAMRRRFGRDVTGEKLSELLGDDQFAEHSERLHALLANGRPLLLETRLNEGGRLRLCYEMLVLRVFAADGMTPWAMSGIFFHDWRL
jgi:hypothetical protein